MPRSRSFHTPSPILAAAALCLLLSVLPRHTRAGSVREDPAFREYQEIDRLAGAPLSGSESEPVSTAPAPTPSPTPSSKQSVSGKRPSSAKPPAPSGSRASSAPAASRKAPSAKKVEKPAQLTNQSAKPAATKPARVTPKPKPGSIDLSPIAPIAPAATQAEPPAAKQEMLEPPHPGTAEKAASKTTENAVKTPESPAKPSEPSPAVAQPEVRVVETRNEMPVCAVIDLETDTLDPKTVNTLSHAVWGEVQRGQRMQLLELQTSRQRLASHDLTPSDPYRPRPSRQQMAEILPARYLIMGNANVAENTYVMELLLYDSSSNSIISSQPAITSEGFGDLLRKIPALVKGLQRYLPRTVVGASREAGAGSETGGTGPASPRAQTLEHEIEQLRLDNDRMRGEISSLQERLGLTGAQSPPKRAVSMKTPVNSKEAQSRKSSPTVQPTAPVNASGLPAQSTPQATLESVVKPEPTPEAAVAKVVPPVSEIPELSSAPSPKASPSPTAAPPAPPLGKKETTATKPSPTPAASPKPTATPSPTPTPQPSPEAAKPAASPTPAPVASTPAPTPAPTESAEDAAKKQAQAKFDESQRYPVNSPAGVKPLEEAIGLDPKNPKYQRALIMRLYNSKQYSLCAEKGEKFIQQGAVDPDMQLFVSAAYSSVAEYDKALKVLDGVLKANPNNRYAQYNRALNLYLKNDPSAAEAFRSYLKASRDDPEQAQWVIDAEKKLQDLEATPAAKP